MKPHDEESVGRIALDLVNIVDMQLKVGKSHQVCANVVKNSMKRYAECYAMDVQLETAIRRDKEMGL